MLVSATYKEQLETLHQEDSKWGSGPRLHVDRIGKFLCENKVKSFVDYGCGKGRNVRFFFSQKVYSYDPGVSEWSAEPPQDSYLICMDVLEHIEPDLLDNVLEHMVSKFTKKALCSLSTVASRDILPDGRNAHLIQESISWWIPRIEKHCTIESIEFRKSGASYIITLTKI